MENSRRDFLRFSVAAGRATAFGGLIGSGANLGPVVAWAQELRIKGAKVKPSVCPYCSVGCATLIHTIDDKIVKYRGRSAQPAQRRRAVPKRRGDLPAACQSQSADSGLASSLRRNRMGIAPWAWLRSLSRK